MARRVISCGSRLVKPHDEGLLDSAQHSMTFIRSVAVSFQFVTIYRIYFTTKYWLAKVE